MEYIGLCYSLIWRVHLIDKSLGLHRKLLCFCQSSTLTNHVCNIALNSPTLNQVPSNRDFIYFHCTNLYDILQRPAQKYSFYSIASLRSFMYPLKACIVLQINEV